MRKPPKTRHTVQPMSQPKPCVASSAQPERSIASGSARNVFETKPPKVASDQPATKTMKKAMPSARRVVGATEVSGFTDHCVPRSSISREGEGIGRPIALMSPETLLRTVSPPNTSLHRPPDALAPTERLAERLDGAEAGRRGVLWSEVLGG